jgi:CxxC motif-containing protein (DUF1111 family)
MNATKNRGGFMKVTTRSSLGSLRGGTIFGGGVGILIAGFTVIGCGAPQGDDVATATATSQALVGTISGTVSDTAGRPLANVRVVLSGRTQATITTGNTGTYSFALNVPDATASWAVQPTRTGCTFNPTVINFNSINGSRVGNFSGSGSTCVGVAQNIVAVDPGPRGGTVNAGQPLLGLSLQEQALFMSAQEVFQEVDSVTGDGVNGEDGKGLGPTFNSNACSSCHAEPAVGGSSPGSNSPFNPVTNPQIAIANLRGATNVVPSFITANGPMREARFPTALGGGVADLFTIQGRDDAQGCVLAQPNFAQAQASGDIIFRIATPTFGLGLFENTPDLALQANLAANAAQKAALGISGKLNTSGNDGTVTKFGWKAQNKSLLIFAGEAYNVEQGVSNEAFTNERSAVAGCVFNGSPEDHTDNDEAGTGATSDVSSDLVNFAAFMRFLAPPDPAPATPSTTNGQAVFSSVGCAACHTRSLTTGPSPFAPLNNAPYSPYSDIALHNMGALADGVPQGGAAADEFRTAPLWGAGQRLFFLHDGRTSDIVAAIRAHQSAGSEANTAVANMAAQSPTNQQDLVNFLRSL